MKMNAFLKKFTLIFKWFYDEKIENEVVVFTCLYFTSDAVISFRLDVVQLVRSSFDIWWCSHLNYFFSLIVCFKAMGRL